ncbi:MAG: hypothetical protein ACYCT2_04785 [Thermoplasmataceae archaeon]
MTKNRIIVQSGDESPGSKGRRKIAWGFGGIVIFMVLLISGPALGSAMAPPNQVVLQAESHAVYVFNQTGGPIPFAVVNSTAEFSLPLNTTVVYVEFNLTAGELNARDAGRVNVTTGFSGNLNATLGFGTNTSSFIPEAYRTAVNGSEFTIPVSYGMLTGNQTVPMIIRLNSTVSSYHITVAVYGNSGFTSPFGPASTEQVLYWIGGIVLGASAFMGSPIHDIRIGKRRR